MPSHAVIAILLLAFWDSWRWLVQRTWVTPDEAVTLLVMIAVVAGSAILQWRRRGALGRLAAWPFAAALLSYGTAILVAPPIVCAAIAVATTLAAVWSAGHRQAPPLAFWGLCCLVLPIVPTLQFYLGYPMRVVSAVLTVPLLQLNGLAVTREGTALVWNGEHIQFDAPCSGVTMVWAGMLLVFAVATIQRHDFATLVRAVMAGLRLLLVANVLRAASLFYVEVGTLPLRGEAWHQAIGLAAFGLAMLGLLRHLRRTKPCAV